MQGRAGDEAPEHRPAHTGGEEQAPEEARRQAVRVVPERLPEGRRGGRDRGVPQRRHARSGGPGSWRDTRARPDGRVLGGRGVDDRHETPPREVSGVRVRNPGHRQEDQRGVPPGTPDGLRREARRIQVQDARQHRLRPLERRLRRPVREPGDGAEAPGGDVALQGVGGPREAGVVLPRLPGTDQGEGRPGAHRKAEQGDGRHPVGSGTTRRPTGDSGACAGSGIASPSRCGASTRRRRNGTTSAGWPPGRRCSRAARTSCAS